MTVSARLYSVSLSSASLSPLRSQRFHSLTASAPSTPWMSSALEIPRETSNGLRPPRYPTFLEAKRRSNCGMSQSMPGKLFLRTGTSKQLPLNVTSISAPSRASDSASGVRSTPWVRVTVSLLECTVTTVTRASLLRPSVSISRYLAPSPNSPKSLQCSPFGVMSASAPQSRSSNSSAACISTASSRSFASGFRDSTLSDAMKSFQVRMPDSHMALSFFAPTDGRSTNVLLITGRVNGLPIKNCICATGDGTKCGGVVGAVR